MAQDWYLLKSPYSQLSGYESEALDDFAEESFAEILDSEMAVTVELCNYDLSDCKQIKAVVQNNIQDTGLKSLVRHLYVPIGTCKSGMYVKYKNRYWLITGLVDDNKMFEKAVMSLCNYLLTWTNDRGKIIQRWANVVSASQYNNGETSTRFNYYNFRSDQLMVSIANDEESLMINSGMRFIIDNRCKVYEKELSKENKNSCNKPVIVYEVTRSDSVLYDYIDGGYFEFMVTQDEQRETDGYYIIDDKGYWLCKEPVAKVDKIPISLCEITCDEPIIYNGLEPNVFVAKFYDAEGKEIWVSPQWEINCDFIKDLNVDYIDNSIEISVDNDKLLNKTFELSLGAFGYEPTTIEITIKGFS